jgi:NADPH-dependent glutamate synthase beta subunit-like oxidoreductase
LRTSSSHEEGAERKWSITTKEFLGKDGTVRKLRCAELEWERSKESGKMECVERPGSEFEIEADLVLLAAGFLHVEHGPLVADLGLSLDPRGNIEVDPNSMSSVPGVFATGDAMRGASLVVTAMHDGRAMADGVDAFLRDGGSVKPA